MITDSQTGKRLEEEEDREQHSSQRRIHMTVLKYVVQEWTREETRCGSGKRRSRVLIIITIY